MKKPIERRLKFTKASVEKLALPPGETDFAFYDEAMKGFGIRFRAGGTVGTYFIQYAIGKKHRRIQLGRADQVTLAFAQGEAQQLRAKVALKIDPANERARAVAVAGQTFDPAIDGFLAKLKKTRAESYHAASERYLKQHFKPLHGMALVSIDRATVSKVMHTIDKEKGPTAMNRARSAGSAFFNWAIGAGLCEFNPFEKTNKNDEKARDRTLSPRELKIIWHGVPDNEFGDIVKVLMLTMQRRDEIGGLPITEFNRKDRQLEIDGSRFKNTKDNTIPLSDVAFDILNKRFDATRRHIFGRCDSGFSGWSKAKAELDEALKGINKPWVFHDLRRTGKTVMEEELDVPDPVSEAILNHAKKGLNKVYNTAKYLKKKRIAADQYAAYIMSVVN